MKVNHTANPFNLPKHPTAPFTLKLPQYKTVEVIRQSGSTSRTHIAEAINYSPSKITTVITNLIEDEILEELDNTLYTGGRRQREIFFNGSFGHIIVMHLAMSKLDIAIVDFAEKVRVRRVFPINPGHDSQTILNMACDFATERVKQFGISLEKVIGIGVILPVMVTMGGDDASAIAWTAEQITSVLRDRFPYAVIAIEDETKAMAVGELRKGIGKDKKCFLYINIATPVSAGFIIEGKLYSGVNGGAGAIGQMHLQTPDNQTISLQDALTEISKEDTEKTGQLVGLSVANLVNLLDPELILLGGSANAHELLAVVRRSVLDYALASTTHHLKIELAPLGAEASLLGIMALTLDRVFIPET